jgi:hypothetical protein
MPAPLPLPTPGIWVRMTPEEYAHCEALLSGSLFNEFRTLLNPDLARHLAKFCVNQIAMIQNHKGKQL